MTSPGTAGYLLLGWAPALGGGGTTRLPRMPVELVAFHLWYLRSKGWIERLGSGMLAISATGVDEIEHSRLRLGEDRLLEAHGEGPDCRDVPAE